MPNYNERVAPISLYPGDVGFAFNAESPAAPQSSVQFALPAFRGDASWWVTWQTSFSHVPEAVNVGLQAADQDREGNYATIDTSTNVNGERRSLQTTARFLRIRIVSQRGPGEITVTIGA